jgi:hypothetical protein
MRDTLMISVSLLYVVLRWECRYAHDGQPEGSQNRSFAIVLIDTETYTPSLSGGAAALGKTQIIDDSDAQLREHEQLAVSLTCKILIPSGVDEQAAEQIHGPFRVEQQA